MTTIKLLIDLLNGALAYGAFSFKEGPCDNITITNKQPEATIEVYAKTSDVYWALSNYIIELEEEEPKVAYDSLECDIISLF